MTRHPRHAGHAEWVFEYDHIFYSRTSLGLVGGEPAAFPPYAYPGQ